MYDKKSEANEFVGESADVAKASAARFYGVEVSDLKVSVAKEGEVYGLNGRVALVAYPKNVVPGSKPGDDGGRQGDRGGRNDRGGRGGRGRPGGRERSSSSRGPEDRPVARVEAAPVEAVPVESAPVEAAPAEAVKSTGTLVGELSAVGGFVQGAVERMGLGNFEISENSEEGSGLLVVQLRGPASLVLGAGGVRTSEALQLLANQAAKQASVDAGRVVIDVEGNADDRESSLTALAGKAADRASDSGRSVALDPMNSRDRRIVHVALRDTDKIATMSMGEGRYRQVLIVPEGASEYGAAQSSQS
jgi:predicted RNA-binding protein Jag